MMKALRVGLIAATCVAATGSIYAQASEAGTAATSTISHEPLYADLVARARHLKEETDGFAPSAGLFARPQFQTYAQGIRALSDGDMAGHIDLKQRGTDSDLKCILMGVSLDLNNKLNALQAAKSDGDIQKALGDMSQLLSDNIDVIVTPATVESGLDCVIEFGNR